MIIFYILFKLQMPDKKICKVAFVFLFTYSKMQSFLTDISLLIVFLFEKHNRLSISPYCVSQKRIKTAFKTFNKIYLKKLWSLIFQRLFNNDLRWQNICREINYFCVNLLASYLVLHTLSLRSEDSIISWNFQQIYTVIKDGNWCQSLLNFPDLNPSFDDIK